MNAPDTRSLSLELPTFAPAGALRHADVQSILASSKLRRWRLSRQRPGMRQASRRLILDCGDGVRLHAFHSPRPEQRGAGRGLVVMIHGWEGCRDSVYLACMAARLWDEGYSIVRLDLRDHGDAYHLNEAPFHSARLSDPIGALADIARRLPGGDQPALIGFSLGGNFVLRLAKAIPDQGAQLTGVLAFCPAINPLSTTRALDSSAWIYRWYFWRKWRRSLQAKQRCFPGQYDFSGLVDSPSFEIATERFTPIVTPYAHYLDYFAAYTVGNELLSEINVPTLIATAADDPVVPASDFHGLRLADSVQHVACSHGGHCGFIENIRLDSWAERAALIALRRWFEHK